MKKELNYKFSWSVFAKSFWEKQPVVVKKIKTTNLKLALSEICLLYTSPSPRD